MKKVIILAIALVGLSALVNAQINDSYILNQNDVIIQQNGVYDEISIDGCTYIDEVGNPQLPVKIVSYVLPYNSTVIGMVINIVSQEKLSGNYYVYPVQSPRVLDGSDTPPFVEPNSEIYNSNTPYPSNTVEIINDGYTHGYHVVTVAIYPVEYHPSGREIYLRDISFTINYNSIFDSRLGIPFGRQSAKRAELGKEFVQSMVKNVDDVENFRNHNAEIINNSYYQDTVRGGSTSAIDILVPDYIIITNNELKPVFQQLADWKTKKGTPAIIKTVEEIEPNYQGSDLQEKIRNYLKEAHGCYDPNSNNPGYGPSLFILLGGDVNIIPARIYAKTEFATDLYYATVVGTWNYNRNDIFGESDDQTNYNYAFFLGRAPAKDTAQALVFVKKIINSTFGSII
jgi:hypothetical protein